MLHQEMDAADSLLKVILTPAPGLLSSFHSLMPNATEADLQKIMDLKVKDDVA